MLTQRQRTVLQHLRKSPHGIKGEILARELGISSRTLRTDIKSMEHELKAKGIRIGRGNAGYFFEDADAAGLQDVLRDELADIGEDASRSRAFAEAVAEAALRNRAVIQQDMAEQLFISLSTLKSVQKVFERHLARRGLLLKPYRNTGLRIEGEERKVRSFLAETLPLERLRERFEIDAEGIPGILNEVLPMYGIHIADEARTALLKSLLVGILRM